ncbi:MAG TPA: carboxypeptidase regulatory-like domain-containing protein, partial [Planctomycetota bacterium]|nr:carboxypeptidase regulatory-like domain-containing protein [Planctomycetota bacterium]
DAAGGTGVRISGATVKLNTGATTTSSSTGVYTFNIAPGTYTITASKSGYQTKSAKETVIANQEVWESIGLSR